MDAQRARKFLESVGPAQILLPVCILLAASLLLNFWQYARIQKQHSVTVSFKGATAHAEANKQEVDLKRKKARAEADKRVDQLYKDLENLSRLNDQILSPGEHARPASRSRNSLVEPTAVH